MPNDVARTILKIVHSCTPQPNMTVVLVHAYILHFCYVSMCAYIFFLHAIFRRGYSFDRMTVLIHIRLTPVHLGRVAL